VSTWYTCSDSSGSCSWVKPWHFYLCKSWRVVWPDVQVLGFQESFLKLRQSIEMILCLTFTYVKIYLFYILVTVHLGTIPINNQLDAQFLLYIFISILYMFRANLCSSSGESIVSIQHMVYVTMHTGQSPTQSDIYQMLYWYNWLSWWWAQGCSKYEEIRNKYI
jgi:hypothetical protein